MINANIKKAIADAISIEGKAARKWLDAGTTVRAEYESREALEAIRAEFLAEVIYPAMGDDAVRTMKAELPRKGSKEWTGASPALQAEWSAQNDAKKAVRGKGSVYFGRVLDYAFPEDEAGEPTAPRDLKTRCLEELTALIKAVQKAPSIPFDGAAFIAACEAGIKVASR